MRGKVIGRHVLRDTIKWRIKRKRSFRRSLQLASTLSSVMAYEKYLKEEGNIESAISEILSI